MAIATMPTTPILLHASCMPTAVLIRPPRIGPKTLAIYIKACTMKADSTKRCKLEALLNFVLRSVFSVPFRTSSSEATVRKAMAMQIKR